jgi:hypothetical protein
MDTFESLMAEVMAAADRFGHRLLAGHYSSARLASAEARRSWIDPDLAPLPTA